jgi:hypothetical protein
MATANPPSERNTKNGSHPVLASSGAVDPGATVVDDTPDGGTNVVVVLTGFAVVVVVRPGRVVDGAGTVVVDAGALVVVGATVVVVCGSSVVVVVASVVVVDDDGTICASATKGDMASTIDVPMAATAAPATSRFRLRTRDIVTAF